MNKRALLQLGAELMFQFRHDSGPADGTLSAYLRKRKFLGSSDKRFLAEVFFHTLRHLRRFDEAMLSAFSGTAITEPRYSAGFPVTENTGARAWHRPQPGQPPKDQLKWLVPDRAIDTIRLALAAIELEMIATDEATAELERCWPRHPRFRQPQSKAILRMMERAVDVATVYTNARKPVDQERAHSFPGWLWTALAEGRGPDELAALGTALNKQAPVTLRVNTLRASVEEAEEALSAAGIEYLKSDLLEGALDLRERVSRALLPNSGEGWFEMQDAGSQLISVYTGVRPGMTVVDACAGGGGKALHLAALMKNQGRVIVLDADADRLGGTRRRLDRSGASILDLSISMDESGSVPVEIEAQSADLVLVDAPCSGTGALRRNPEARWRLSPDEIERLAEIQGRLLEDWRSVVKTGGSLVYATCSLLRRENQMITDAFLSRHPEFRIAAPEGFPGPLTDRGELLLSPEKHGCDGFYAARLVRN